jgi:hypothetical protein
MTTWEYKTLNLKISEKLDRNSGFFSLEYLQDVVDGSEVELSQLGAEGWEMVSVMPIDSPGIAAGTRNAVAFFKRTLLNGSHNQPLQSTATRGTVSRDWR